MALLFVFFADIGSALAQRDVTVGVHHNPPKIFVGTQGQPTGILGDLLARIAQAENWTLEAVPCHWQECLDAVRSGRIDLLPDVAHTPERANLFDFHSTPSHHSWSQIFARPGQNIESMPDLAGKRIAVLEGSVQQAYLRSALLGFGVRGELIPATNFEQALGWLSTGQADAIATNHHYGAMAVRERGLESTPIMFNPSRLFYASAKGENQDLLDAIDKHLEPWRADRDSFFYQNLNRWAGATVITEIPRLLLWVGGGIVFLLLATIAVVVYQRRIVKRRTTQVKETESKFSTILNSIDAGIFIKDSSLRYQYVNDNICAMLGLKAHEIIGRDDFELFGEKVAKDLRERDLRILNNEDRFTGHERIVRSSSNKSLTVFTVKRPLRNAKGKPYAIYGIATDLSQEHEHAEKLERVTKFDSLTSLPNRASFLQTLEYELVNLREADHHIGLILIDLDNFKSLNDTRGHIYGDLLLVSVAKRLSENTYPENSHARLSGDMFALLLKNLPLGQTKASQTAHNVALELSKSLSMPQVLDDMAYQGSASIGVTLINGTEATAHRALRHAELALYEAKAAGRNQIRMFEPWMEQAASQRSELEHELKIAIENHQFIVHYQLQVSAENLPTGVEALVRWQHPVKGLIMPGGFIEFAEKSDMILAIGEQVFEIACKQIATWQRSEYTKHLVIAVNVSAQQLYDPEFLQKVDTILEKTGANPRRLEIEITESLLIADIDAAILTMQALRERGVRISLDDFGTGFSSLNHLRKLPLDQLKIDRAFIRDLSVDLNDEAIVKTIIDLGNNLQINVIAEGVETWQQRDTLLQMGCTRFQGYLFGLPTDIDHLNLDLQHDLDSRSTR